MIALWMGLRLRHVATLSSIHLLHHLDGVGIGSLSAVRHFARRMDMVLANTTARVRDQQCAGRQRSTSDLYDYASISQPRYPMSAMFVSVHFPFGPRGSTVSGRQTKR